jgi:hypothetical protein
MPILLVIGLLIIAGGLALFVSWFDFFWQLFKALAPLGVITLGGVLTYFGLEEKKERKGAVLDFSSPAEASRYHAEALAYQERLNDFQEPIDNEPIPVPASDKEPDDKEPYQDQDQGPDLAQDQEPVDQELDLEQNQEPAENGENN